MSALVNNFYVIVLSRSLYGLCSGAILTATPKWLDETVPPHLLDYGFGNSINISVNVGVLVMMFMGNIVPESDDVYGNTHSQSWKYVMMFPIPISLISLLMIHFNHNHDSLQNLV